MSKVKTGLWLIGSVMIKEDEYLLRVSRYIRQEITHFMKGILLGLIAKRLMHSRRRKIFDAFCCQWEGHVTVWRSLQPGPAIDRTF